LLEVVGKVEVVEELRDEKQKSPEIDFGAFLWKGRGVQIVVHSTFS